MAIRAASCLPLAAAVAAAILAMPTGATAQERTMPVPSVIIYPNTIIQPDMLVDRPVLVTNMTDSNYFIQDRDSLIGKVTRRTLLPNAPIAATAVAEPHVIGIGAQVRVVFSEDGVTISTYGSAMQAGAIGDIVRVRNSDSGVIISGVVEADGTVRVGDLVMLRLAIALALSLVVSAASAQVRIKDISELEGVRDNQLIGYGLAVGLQGTGDTLRNVPFTDQSLQSMMDRLGVNVRGQTLRTRNVAAVIVTADLPPFAGAGSRIDVNVSSLGDASSLVGGTLFMTPLAGADGVTYAVAQGSIAVSGFAVAGQAETLTQGVPTAGRIANGALIERAAPAHLDDSAAMILELTNPDFETAVRVADAINEFTAERYGIRVAREIDERRIYLNRPSRLDTARFMAEIGELTVEPDAPARVVVDERTGTIVIGQDVKISTVAVTHGNLTVRVTETPTVSQPQPFSNGKTVVTPQTTVDADQQGGEFSVIQGSNLRTLVRGLNQIGLKPPDIIAILQAIKSAGALQAELVVQ